MSASERTMKVWEETWEYQEGYDRGPQVFSKVGPDDWELVAEHDWRSSDVPVERVESRAKLAAVAPEMARLLLRIEALGEEEDARDIAKAICIELLPKIQSVLQKAGAEVTR